MRTPNPNLIQSPTKTFKTASSKSSTRGEPRPRFPRARRKNARADAAVLALVNFPAPRRQAKISIGAVGARLLGPYRGRHFEISIARRDAVGARSSGSLIAPDYALSILSPRPTRAINSPRRNGGPVIRAYNTCSRRYG